MKIVRFQTTNGQTAYGRLHADGRTIRLAGEIFGELTDTGEPAAVARLLAPIEPCDITCIGLNYRKHAAEGNQPNPEWPVVFMKNSGTLQHPGEPIVLPRHLKSDAVDYECELAVVIGRECYNVSKADALSYVLRYTCANDVSARDWQMKYGGSQWCRGKTMQDWNTNDMIFDVPTLIEFLSGSTRLAAGTVILTGTPHGVGGARKPPAYLQPGDTVTIEIDGLGKLTNPVIAEGVNE